MDSYEDICQQVENRRNFLQVTLVPKIDKMLIGNLKALKKKRYDMWKGLIPEGLYKAIIRSNNLVSYDVLEKRNYYNFIPPIFNNSESTNAAEVANIIRLIQLDLQIKNYVNQTKEPISNVLNAMRYLEHNDLGTVINFFKSKQEKGEYHEHEQFVRENEYLLQDFLEQVETWDYQINHLSKVQQIINVSREKYLRIAYQFLASIKTNKDINAELPFNQELVNYITTIKKHLEANGYHIYHNQLKESWNSLKANQAKKDLKKHPIQFLQNKYPDLPNMDILVAKGLTVADIADLSIDELHAMYNIPTRDAQQIYEKVAETKADVLKNAMPKFNADNLDNNKLIFLSLLNFDSQYSEYQIKTQKNVLSGINLFNRLYQSLRKKVKTRYDINHLAKDDYKIWLQNLKSTYKIADTIRRVNDEELNLYKHPETDLEKVKEDFIKNSALYFTLIEKFSGQDTKYATASLPQDIVEQVNNFKLIIKNLNVKMRKYQIFGTKYILSYRSVLLGDEMGLGKTIQALGAINHLYQTGERHAIVVCPLSILENWKQEAKKWSKLPIFAYRGTKRTKAFNSWRKIGGILVTNYEQCFRIAKNKNLPNISCIIVDEAHYIKNPEAKRTKNVIKLVNKAKYKLFMSGTPLENNLAEMKQLISILNPNVLKEIKKREEITPISVGQFREMIATVYLRRKRKEVLAELPKISIINKYSAFTHAEQDFYDICLEEASEGMALGALMKMRRAAFLDKESEKIDQIKEIATEAKADGKKVLVFSFFKEAALRKLAKLIPNTMDEILSGDISAQARQKLVERFTNSKDKNVLLSQIDAGGVGLNIQTASIVVLCEPQWKPSTEQQAISRVYRMGQTRDVLVYRLLTLNSLDETMDKLIQAKQAVFDAYANDSALQDAFSANLKELKTKAFKIEKKRLLAKKYKLAPSPKKSKVPNEEV